MVERTEHCGCRTRHVPLPPVVEGVPYTNAPIEVTGFDSCGRHADWIEAVAESHAIRCGYVRLDREGVVGVRWEHDGTRIVFTAPTAPRTLRDRLNATEPDQDWRHPCIPAEHAGRFHGLVVKHLLACRLATG